MYINSVSFLDALLMSFAMQKLLLFIIDYTCGMMRLFNKYDRLHHTTIFILFKALLLYIVILVVAELLISLSYALLPSKMTSLIDFEGERLTMSGIRSFSTGAWVRVVLIGPLMEETAYRLWQSMKKWHIALSLSFLLYYLFGDVFISFGLKSLNYAIISAILSLCIGCLFYLKMNENMLKKIKDNSKCYALLVLFSCMLFALSHVTNYMLNSQVLLFGVISSLRHLVGGISFAYVRINLGFFCGWIAHCLVNLFYCLMSTL